MGTKHTLLPYRVEAGIFGDPAIVSGSLFVATTHLDKLRGYRRAERIANADFIVRACNSHYGLLEALKRLMWHTSPLRREAGLDESAAYAQVRRSAEAEIAKAEGRE